MNRVLKVTAIALFAASFWAATGFGAVSTTVGFDGGDDGGFTGNAFFEATGGNPGGVAHHNAIIFFNELRTGAPGEPANADFLGDYSLFESATFTMDVKTNSLTDFIGNPIARSIGIALKNESIQGPDGTAGVFIEMGLLGIDFTPDWTTLTVTIDDPMSTTLPAGWIGFGDTDGSFEPVLPAGVTFADILAGVTEFDVTGAVPGYFYSDAIFDVLIDNISLTVTGAVSVESSSLSSIKSLY